MTYQEALAYISRLGRFAMKLGTERTTAILDRLGNPEHGLKGALIAGTNGKGSTAVCLASILQSAGDTVGFMPKPHLISYTERIQINGVPISENDFVDTLAALMPTLEAVAVEMGEATEFEMLTAMALAYLAPRIDRLVCEVGLGGRLDATNALDLGVAVITNVDLDHQKYLGDTIEQIAREKAAIIKPGNQVISGCEGAALEIVEASARNAGASVWRLGREIELESKSRGWDGHLIAVRGPGFEHTDLELPLIGDYQPANAALAVAAAHALDDVPGDAVRRGLAATIWPGRLQLIAKRPRVVLDGGHNPAAMTKSGAALRRLIGSDRLIAVFAMISERDPVKLLSALRTLRPDGVVFTEPGSAGGHAISSDELAAAYGSGAESVRPALAALQRAKELAGADGNVLVCGSLYLVGEILALTKGVSHA
ncbi:MAG TPA: folylpolyglutamate synthase/dihydrofolate synthase family protein [Candidatus Dormibacteraeota bacterium]|nr:folylpolyglutamate synthase/dihydrofolate synthase family protein [Candidatus Dormibacteraeota bacterium]